MFEKLFRVIPPLKGLFSDSTSPEDSTGSKQTPVQIYNIGRASLYKDMNSVDGPALHIISSKSAGYFLTQVEGSDIYTPDGTLIAEHEDTEFSFPENVSTRIIHLESGKSAAQVEADVRIWPAVEGISRIGLPKADPDAKHIVTFIPAGVTRDTKLERIILEAGATEEQWSFFRKKVDVLANNQAPQPLAEK